MAPFNTHFLVAEKIWPTIQAMVTWPETCSHIHYGQFCFGCVAPDVDKVSTLLTQKDTHFFDRTGQYDLMATHRTAEFIRRQADFFCKPFAQLCPQAQAFALGYLCHLCVDEVSKHMWRYPTWIQFKDIGPGAAFAALDEAARRQTQNYAAVVQALDSIKVVDVIPHIPLADLKTTLLGVQNFVHAGTTEGEYLALVDMFDRPTPAVRAQKQQRFQTTINVARQQVDLFKLDVLIKVSLTRSRERLTDLIVGRTPEPSYPLLK